MDPATAQDELTSTVATNVAGSYSGTYGGGDTGTWTLTIDSSGNVSGSYTGSKDSGPVSGALVNGTTFTGAAGSATWIGTVDTSKSATTGTGPYLFTGTWTNGDTASGSFTN